VCGFMGMLLAYESFALELYHRGNFLSKRSFVHHDSIDTFWISFLSTMSHFNIDPFSSPHYHTPDMRQTSHISSFYIPLTESLILPLHTTQPPHILNTTLQDHSPARGNVLPSSPNPLQSTNH
jgi:hypothetical protein